MDNMEYNDINPLWKLVDPLTVEQASALIAGVDPNFVKFYSNDEVSIVIDGHDIESNDLAWVKTAFAALRSAVNAKRLKSTIRRTAWTEGWNEELEDDERYIRGVDLLQSDIDEATNIDANSLKKCNFIYRVEPNWEKTTIEQSDLIKWLDDSGIQPHFFFNTSSKTPDYLDPNNSRYAFKLAAAVKAWQSIDDPKGKPPKQALIKWLREHAHEFGLTDDEGKTNETGIEEIAKVANWKQAGGAPKTLDE